MVCDVSGLVVEPYFAWHENIGVDLRTSVSHGVAVHVFVGERGGRAEWVIVIVHQQLLDYSHTVIASIGLTDRRQIDLFGCEHHSPIIGSRYIFVDDFSSACRCFCVPPCMKHPRYAAALTRAARYRQNMEVAAFVVD